MSTILVEIPKHVYRTMTELASVEYRTPEGQILKAIKDHIEHSQYVHTESQSTGMGRGGTIVSHVVEGATDRDAIHETVKQAEELTEKLKRGAGGHV